MIRINQIKLPPVCEDEEAELRKKAARLLRVNPAAFLSFSIVRKSLDARKKPEIYAVYTVDVKMEEEQAVFRKIRGRNGQIQTVNEQPYRFPMPEKPRLDDSRTNPAEERAGFGAGILQEPSSCGRPVIVGTGRPGFSAGICWRKRDGGPCFWSGERKYIKGRRTWSGSGGREC